MAFHFYRIHMQKKDDDGFYDSGCVDIGIVVADPIYIVDLLSTNFSVIVGAPIQYAPLQLAAMRVKLGLRTVA